MDRIQTIGRGNMIFKERCCRVSYGVRCREEYQPDKNKAHVGQHVVLDSRDGKKYVENQIDWFVKQVNFQPAIKSLDKLKKTDFPGRECSQRWFLEAILVESEAWSGRPFLENDHHHVD